MWKLVIEDDEGKRTAVPLTREDYSIGRKEGNTIRLTERNVSRDHAKLHKKNGASDGNGASTDPAALASMRYVLEDLTSYNGVYVNGLRVSQAQELAHGDLIQIGDYRIVLQDDAAAETESAVPLDSEDMKATIPQVQGLPLRSQMMLEQPNRLIMLAGPAPGQEFPLVGERLTIGRAEEATISVNHNSVSRLHCEVHALGEGRFEIVDKGSSNGVRVNGADLRRGIIEAGDVIELGDVKFKFVGAGQIFRAGASESQQLAAISNRTASLIAGERRRASIVPYVALGAFVGIAVAGWFYFKKPETAPIAVTTTTTPLSADQATLSEAKRACDTGDCESAHQRIAQLPDDSPARQAQEFKDIEFKWATMQLLRADSEPDLATKKGLLDRVASAMTVDSALRKTASDRLALLDSGPVLAMGPKDSGRATAANPTTALPQHSHPAPPDPTPAPVPVHSVVPGPTHTPPPPHQSAFELAKSDNPEDWQKARNILEPRVYGGKANVDEIRLLKALCKKQGDRTCVETCNSMSPTP